MLGVVFAPFIMSGLLATIGVAIGSIFIVIFFMLIDRSCAMVVLFVIGLIILLCL